MLIIRRLNCIDAASGVVTISKWPSGAQVEREMLCRFGSSVGALYQKLYIQSKRAPENERICRPKHVGLISKD